MRGPAKSPGSALSAMFSSAAVASTTEDTYAVHAYLLSRDAVRRLERENNLRVLLARPEADPISRFPGMMYWRQDFEALYASYERFVLVEIDSTSGVSTLHVKAYRPEDAQRIAQALVTFGEQLVNTLNERARHDKLSTFQRRSDRHRTPARRYPDPAYELSRQGKDAGPQERIGGADRVVGADDTQLANAKAQLAQVMKIRRTARRSRCFRRASRPSKN